MQLKLQQHQALPQLAQAGPSLLQDQPSVAHNPLQSEFLHQLQKSSKQQRAQQHHRDERKQAAPSSTPIEPQNQRIELDGCRQMQHTLPQLTSAASASSTTRAPQPAAPAAPSQEQQPSFQLVYTWSPSSSEQQRAQQHHRDERKQVAPSSTPIEPQNQRIELDGYRQMQHTLPQLTSAASASSTTRAPPPRRRPGRF